MKSFRILQVLASLALVFAGSVFAQLPTLSTTSDAVAAGDPVTIDLNWDNIGQVSRTLQFDLLYDPAVLTSVDVSACPNPAYFIIGTLVFECVDAEPGRVAFGLLINTATGVETGMVGTLTFTTNPDAPANVYDFAFANVLLENDAPASTDPGSVEILPPPQPDWSSVPGSGAGLDWFNKVVDTGAYPLPLLVTNAGEADSTLTGTCQVSGSAVFSIVGDNTLGAGLAMGESQNITVECDTNSATLVLHQGTLSCEHNGDGTTETSITDYALSCNITAGPQPEYTSVPAAGSPIALGPTEQNDQDPTADVAITNTGDIPSVLDGTCMIMAGGDPQITLTTDGVFSVADDAAADVETVSCDATAAPDTYNATLSCSHDGSNASPATYAVSCEITPPGQAKFRSDPEPGAVDMTPGDNPPVDDPPPTSLLTFFNEADPGDSDLNIACSISDNAAISVLPDISGGIAIAPDTNSSVTFSCDTASADSFSATYSCEFTLDGTSLPAGVTASLPAGVNGGVQQATYTYTCDVREAEADVVPAPAPGPMTRSVQPGGTAVYTVVFSEVADENEDGELTSCSLADGTNFTIISPALADFPVIIPAGGPSVTVTVEGTDPGDGSNPTDTLTCTYSDTANPEGTDAVYPLVLEVRAFSDVPIPTLGRYGLAILVLLMLGMGLLGFRRFS